MLSSSIPFLIDRLHHEAGRLSPALMAINLDPDYSFPSLSFDLSAQLTAWSA